LSLWSAQFTPLNWLVLADAFAAKNGKTPARDTKTRPAGDVQLRLCIITSSSSQMS
jgi:hypothetical protein